jgi:WD40 repeat protein
MISGIEGKDFAITGLYVLDENLLLVNSSCNTARKGFLYLVNIKEKKLAAMQEIPSPAQVAVNIPLSQFSVFQAYNKKIDVYDLRTLKHLFAIPECPDLYVTNCAFSPSGNVMLQGGFGDDRDEICLFVARNNRWEFAGRIFGVSTKEYFILDPNFYSDQIILFLLANPNRSTPKQLCFFDLREKKIVKKYPAPVWGYSKRQGDYLIWED